MGAAPRMRRLPIPLTLLTGALGAGKTTLLNRLLTTEAFAATAVIVNEVGRVTVAGAVVERVDSDIVSLSGGCVCCVARGELVDALERLLRAVDNGRVEQIRRVVIETAGSADPIPILYLLARHPYLSLRYRLDGIVTAVHPDLEASLAHDENRIQIATADRIVAVGASDTVIARIRRLNPAAPILASGPAENLASGLTGAFDPPEDDAGIVAWLGFDAFTRAASGSDGQFASWLIPRDGSMPATALYEFLDRLVLDHGSQLVRFRGLIADSEDAERPLLLHGIGGLFSPPRALAHWPDADRRSRLAVTGRDLDRGAVERLFDAFLGGPQIDTPDRAALLDNPLAIPGFRAR
jgi:G3E family GTPase